jgi:hypothetical protein
MLIRYVHASCVRPWLSALCGPLECAQGGHRAALPLCVPSHGPEASMPRGSAAAQRRPACSTGREERAGRGGGSHVEADDHVRPCRERVLDIGAVDPAVAPDVGPAPALFAHRARILACRHLWPDEHQVELQNRVKPAVQGHQVADLTWSEGRGVGT